MNTGSTSSDDLLALARGGSGTALGRLLEMYRRYLKMLALLQIDDRLQAKVDPSDVVQETFLEAHRDFAAFRGTTEKQLMAWLRKMLATNLADRVHRHYGAKRRDVRREQSLHLELDRSSRTMDRALVVPQSSPSARVIRREQAVVLADALDQLSAGHREVLVLRHLKGLPFAEVARRMGRSEGSVQLLWTRALARLRRVIGEQE